jgi:hypothetical protein
VAGFPSDNDKVDVEKMRNHSAVIANGFLTQGLRRGTTIGHEEVLKAMGDLLAQGQSEPTYHDINEFMKAFSGRSAIRAADTG